MPRLGAKVVSIRRIFREATPNGLSVRLCLVWIQDFRKHDVRGRSPIFLSVHTGLHPVEALPDTAAELLCRGYDSPALRELAEHRATMRGGPGPSGISGDWMGRFRQAVRGLLSGEVKSPRFRPHGRGFIGEPGLLHSRESS